MLIAISDTLEINLEAIVAIRFDADNPKAPYSIIMPTTIYRVSKEVYKEVREAIGCYKRPQDPLELLQQERAKRAEEQPPAAPFDISVPNAVKAPRSTANRKNEPRVNLVDDNGR